MELYDIWFKKHFLRYTPAVRPILLLVDGHSSHHCLDTINLALSEGVTLFVLPPNTTHLTQPLDKGIFGPLKVRWKEVCYQYLSANPGRVVTRYEFSWLFGEAWLTMTVKNITSGFSTTGIFPTNRNAISLTISSPEQHQPCRRAPLYTPAKKYPSHPIIELHDPHISDESPDDYCKELDDASAVAFHPAEHQSTLSKFLVYPSPPIRCGGTSEQTYGRVLTSKENVEAIEAKRRKKEEEQEKKKRRAEERSKKGPKKGKKPTSKGMCKVQV